jgi:putative addiction module component (TIGR02574 family)
MDTLGRADILKLSLSERLQLVEDIWDSIAECPEAIELTDRQKAELERRLEAFRQDPHAGSPWAEVRERIRNSR